MIKAALTLLILFTAVSLNAQEEIGPLIYKIYSTPDLTFYTDAKKMKIDFKREFEKLKTGFDSIDAIPYNKRTLKNTLYRMDDLLAQMDFPNIILLAYVSTDKELRDAAQSCEEQVNEFLSSFNLRKGTYQALKDLREKYQGKLSSDEKRFLDEGIKDFELEGVQLEDEKRARLEDINSQLSKLSIDFSKNIREENSGIDFSADELKGVPETALERLGKDKDGRYILKTDYPTNYTVMKYAEISETRKRYNELFQNRAYPANIPLLKEILTLKKEKAGVLGRPAIRDVLLANKMARTPENVNAFLKNLQDVISERAASDRETLQKANDGKNVNYWDIRFLENRLIQERFDVDEEKVREYFSLESTIKGCMAVYEELFSIKFVEEKPKSTWHPDVTKYVVMSEGKKIAAIYLDLFPRENKYSHAAQFDLRGGRLISKDYYESPVIALVCNFTKPAKDKPSLLSLDEVSTFFHEFGHGMHNCLTTAKIGSQAGTSVKRDFVEVPSQMFERWLEKPEILNRFARHYRTGEPMPEELINNIVKLNYFLKAYNTTRQIFYARYDQSVHGPDVPESTTKLWDDMMLEITGYPSQPNTHFEAAFDHLVSGYSAGYYSYLWSDVMSADFFGRFEKEGLLNHELGAELRVKVLSKGDSKDPAELVQDFLGRESNSDAFMKELQKDIQY
jgi:thimet oligopeptidase